MRALFIQGTYFIAMLLLPLSTSSPTMQSVTERQPNCMDVVIPIKVSATCIKMAPSTTFEQAVNLVTNPLSSLVSLLFDSLVQGTFDIAGTYCEPQNQVPSRSNTLQFLLHGATYDRNYVSSRFLILACFSSEAC
jgi:hypothetical protein